jgi:hypothetical protein
MLANLTNEGYKKRLGTCKQAAKDAKKTASSIHVKLQRGNKKTGDACWTVSLMPVIDCANCARCKQNCYDLKADLRFPKVVEDRAKNSAIHKMDPRRYWSEIDTQIKANYVTQLRINVGGDLSDDDFLYVAQLGRANKNTMILFFTKNYKGINAFLEHHRFPKNVRPIMSAWQGLEMDNPHKLPQSHVLYEDGRTTAPEYGAYYCGGNCTECAFKGEGCWTLKRGEHVIFKAH